MTFFFRTFFFWLLATTVTSQILVCPWDTMFSEECSLYLMGTTGSFRLSIELQMSTDNDPCIQTFNSAAFTVRCLSGCRPVNVVCTYTVAPRTELTSMQSFILHLPEHSYCIVINGSIASCSRMDTSDGAGSGSGGTDDSAGSGSGSGSDIDYQTSTTATLGSGGIGVAIGTTTTFSPEFTDETPIPTGKDDYFGFFAVGIIPIGIGVIAIFIIYMRYKHVCGFGSGASTHLKNGEVAGDMGRSTGISDQNQVAVQMEDSTPQEQAHHSELSLRNRMPMIKTSRSATNLQQLDHQPVKLVVDEHQPAEFVCDEGDLMKGKEEKAPIQATSEPASPYMAMQIGDNVIPVCLPKSSSRTSFIEGNNYTVQNIIS